MMHRLTVRSAKELEGRGVDGRDGRIGEVKDFYFDDRAWTVRYVVVETGSWFSAKRVLISPSSIGRVGWGAGASAVEVDLTQGDVADSPDVGVDRPVSRQHEEIIAARYGWPQYWTGSWLWGSYYLPRRVSTLEPSDAEPEARPSGGDPHLRSMKEVRGYRLSAPDGEFGQIEDFQIEEGTWQVRYIVVDSRKWWIGRKVLVSPDWIDEVSWEDRNVVVGRSKEEIRSAPEWDPTTPLARGYEEALYSHYGEPAYWTRRSTRQTVV